MPASMPSSDGQRGREKPYRQSPPSRHPREKNARKLSFLPKRGNRCVAFSDICFTMICMEYKKTCPICGKEFTAARRDAMCCSSRCRVRKTREAQMLQDEEGILLSLRTMPPAPRKAKPATTENIAEVLTALKGETTALRFYARSCPIFLRPRLTVLADCIDESMKELGF